MKLKGHFPGVGHVCCGAMLLVCAMGLLAAAEGTAREKPTVSSLAWLAGNWSFERSGRIVTERWTAPAGGVMIGTSHTVANDRTIEYEFVIIRADAAGDLQYVAKPSGQPEGAFKLVRSAVHEVVFENPTHDFPQRISYTLKPDGMLLAVVEGTKGGKSRRLEFPYHRMP